MNWAFDRVSKQLVEAHLAREGEPQRYFCPTKTCRGRVFLRRGYIRRDHFAHNPGEGSDSCEDYLPGVYDATSSVESTDIDERRSQMQVALELAVASPHHWKLRFRIPLTSSAVGNAELRYGPDDAVQEIDLTALQHRALVREVNPCKEPLGIIRFRSNVPSSVRYALTPSAITLSTDKYTFFHAGRLSSLGVVGPAYYWGASYYALARTEAVLEPPKDITVQNVGKRLGWRCDLIRLPQERTDEIAEWLAEYSGLAPRTRRAKVLLISPPLSIDKPGPEIETTSERTLLVGIHRLGRELLNDTVHVEDELGFTSLIIKNRDSAAIEIKLPNRNQRCLYIRFGTEPGVLIDCKTKLTSALPRDTTRLSAVNRVTKRRCTAVFGTLAAQTLLRGIKRGEYTSLKVIVDKPTHADIVNLSPHGTVRLKERLLISGADVTSGLALRLARQATTLLVTVPGYGSQYIYARNRSDYRTPSRSRALVDKSDAALLVQMRYSSSGVGGSGDHLARSVAQSIADRYAITEDE